MNLLAVPISTERPRWQDDRQASEIMCRMLELGRSANVSVIPVYAVSDNPALTIVDMAATLGIDVLMLGVTTPRLAFDAVARQYRGTEVAKNLPENIQLVIHS